MKGFYANSSVILKLCSRFLARGAGLLAAVFLLSATGAAYANPAGGTVSAGSAGISAAGDTLTVTQTSNRAVIDWRSFDINENETTNFVQPSSAAMTLNRIGGQDPSRIMGTLTANGKIYLVNPNGLIFGKNANVNVGSLLATTANIGTLNFMKGAMKFNHAGKAEASIVNSGLITAKEAGLVGLVAPSVINDGVITARLGRVNLASGDTLTLDMYGDNLVNIALQDETAVHLVKNGGIIAADGGTVAMTAAAGRSVANGAVSNTGVIQANAVAEKDGKIILYAEGSNAVKNNVAADKGKKSGGSTVLVSGSLSAMGLKDGETGGSITVTGDNVGVASDAVISASGRAGGGTVKIGGDYLGGGDTPAAKNVYVAAGATVYNDAVDTGDGGRTTVWSDGDTYFYGNIYARGGWEGGNGGFAETSGHDYLDAQGYVDLTAPDGGKGVYLLDPDNIAIYGNVDPSYVSTDGSINLASSLVLWLDPANRASVTLTYSADGLSGRSVTGTAGGNTLTLSGAVSSSALAAGARIRIGASGVVSTADTLGADTYTVASVSGTTITTVESLTDNYSSAALYRGLASSWADQSGQGNNAVSSGSAMPLWVGNALNDTDVLKFDGDDDIMTVADSSTLDGTTGLTLLTTNTPLTLDNSTAEAILSKRTDVGTQQSYSLFYYTGNKLNVDLDGNNNRFTTSGAFGNGVTNMFSLVYNGTLTAAQRVNLYNQGVLVKTAAESSAAIPDYASPLVLGSMHVTDGRNLGALYSDVIVYRSALGDTARTLMEQYQSAKWGVALSPAGSGATEAAKAMASTARGDAADGYSVFTTDYLERLSRTADISLQAGSNITLDLQGDNLSLNTGRSLSLTAGNDITAVSGGAVTTTDGNIVMTAGGALDVSKISLTANNGAATLQSGGAMALGDISANSVLAQTTGSGADIAIADGATVSGLDAGTAVTLVSAGDFDNGGALSAVNGRWLVYSGDPADDAPGGLAADFRRYSCAYGGSCPALGAGNGLLYRVTPLLTATPSGNTVVYGKTADLSGYNYGLSGYLSAGDEAGDSVTGSLTGATAYVAGDAVGTYNIDHAGGTLVSAGGYGFVYADSAAALSVTTAPLTIAPLPASKPFGKAYRFAPAAFSSMGLFDGDAVSTVSLASAGASPTAAVGNYSIIAGNATGTGLGNYTITYIDGVLDVVPSSLSGQLASATNAALQQASRWAASSGRKRHLGGGHPLIEITEPLAAILGLSASQRFLYAAAPFTETAK
jgi:filamentous hemagglutinin family protein